MQFNIDPDKLLYLNQIAKKSGKTYREVKSLLDKMRNDANHEILNDPAKHVYADKSVDVNALAYKKLEEYLNNPTAVTTEKLDDANATQTNQEFGNEIEQNLTDANMPVEAPQPDIETEQPTPTEENIEQTAPTEGESESDVPQDQLDEIPTDAELDELLSQL